MKNKQDTWEVCEIGAEVEMGNRGFMFPAVMHG